MAGGGDGPSPQGSGTETLTVEGPPRVRNKRNRWGRGKYGGREIDGGVGNREVER